MKKFLRVRMQVSIASAAFSFQPGEVTDVEEDLAQKWVAVGHAVRVSPQTPLSLRDFDYRDLDAEEALTRRCVHCDRRAQFVLRNKPFCPACYQAELET